MEQPVLLDWLPWSHTVGANHNLHRVLRNGGSLAIDEGRPAPGMELKFVPNGEELELRVRGVSVFPGYRDAPQLTARAFDAEGCHCIGDAGRLADEAHPEQGVVFDGRVAEDFNLGTGTWVSVGTLRVRVRVRVVLALAPWAQDAVARRHLPACGTPRSTRSPTRCSPAASLRAEGQAAGLSNYLVGDGEGLAKAMALALARQMATNAPLSNDAITQALPRIAEMAPAEGLFVQSLMSAIAQGDEAAKARVRDFLAKRAGKAGKSS